MYTKKEIAKLGRALKKVEACSGDCKHCENCHFYSAEVSWGIAYAFGCDALPQDHFTYISNSVMELKNDAIDLLRFELS